MSSAAEMKRVLMPDWVALYPRAMARCVFPRPEGPSSTTFSARSTKVNVAKLGKQRLGCAGGEGEVVLLEGLDAREPCRAGEQRAAALLAFSLLRQQYRRQNEAQRRTLSASVPHASPSSQHEALAEIADSLEFQSWQSQRKGIVGCKRMLQRFNRDRNADPAGAVNPKDSPCVGQRQGP